MQFKEEFIVEAPQSEAWQFFSNFPDPIQVLPGLTELKQTAPQSYLGAVRVGLGPFTCHFKGEMHVILLDPETYRVNISGNAHDQQLGGHFHATAYTQTLAHGPNCSKVTITVEVGFGGLLGKLGMFVLRPAAHRVTQHYSQMVNRELQNRKLLTVK